MKDCTQYEVLQQLSDGRDVKLVRLLLNGDIVVRKVLDFYNAGVYSMLMQLAPQGIPRVFAMLQDDDKLVIYEEYIRGKTLEDVLEEQGLPPEEWAKGIMLQLCETLKLLHSCTPAIIHRDIKPSNVIITPEHRAVLIDLNAAQFADPSRSRDTVLMGTQGYAAPEQYGFARSDVQADIYAMGVLLNEMLVGRLPNEEITAGNFSAVVERCTKPDPKQRYANVTELERAVLDTGTAGQIFRRYLPPGFRSGNPIHMLIAVIFDAFFAWLMINAIVHSDEGASAYNLTIIFFATLAYLSVVAIACNYLNIHKLLRIDRIRQPWIKLPVITLVCIVVFMLIWLLDNLFAWGVRGG